MLWSVALLSCAGCTRAAVDKGAEGPPPADDSLPGAVGDTPAPGTDPDAPPTGDTPDAPSGTDTPSPDTPSPDTPTADDGPSDTATPPLPAGEDTPPADSPMDPPAAPPDPPSFGAGFAEVGLANWTAQGITVQLPDVAGGEMGELVTAQLADLDADGVRELILSEVFRPTPSPNWHAVLRRGASSDAWTVDGPLSDLLTSVRRGVVGAYDLDEDGAVDLLRAAFDAPIQLRRGTGWLQRDGGIPTAQQPRGGWLHVTVTDLDRDGWIDVVFAPNVCGRTTEVIVPFLRTAVDEWTWIDDLFDTSPRVGATALGTIPGHDGAPDRLVMSGAGCEAADHAPMILEPTGLLQGRPTWTYVDPFPMDALFRYDPSAPFLPIGARRPMGSAVFDVEGDGIWEFGTTLADPLFHAFRILPGLWEDLTPGFATPYPIGGNQTFQLPWAIGPIDLDRDGRIDLMIALGDDFGAFAAPVRNGPYLPMVLWNHGQGGFSEGTDGLDLGPAGWLHTLAIDDLDDDGDPDVLVGGIGDLPRLLRNDVDTGGGSFGVALRGTTSNHLGMGARLHVEVPGLPDQWQLLGATGTEGHAPPERLFFSTGAEGFATRLTIDWPSGLRQVVGPLAAGATHTVVEPSTLTLSEPDRHAPADGAAEITVTVTPRDTAGAARAAAVTIELDATLSGGSWTGPATTSGTTVTRTLRAPTTAAQDRIVVTLDGVPLGVAPRVWWDAP
jgi:hypothetical protein